MNNLVLVSLWLTLNKFHMLFWCLHWWLRTSKCRLGSWAFSVWLIVEIRPVYLVGREAATRGVLWKKDVLRNFANFARPGLATLLKKRLWHRCFPVNFYRTPLDDCFYRYHYLLNWFRFSFSWEFYSLPWQILKFCYHHGWFNVI